MPMSQIGIGGFASGGADDFLEDQHLAGAQLQYPFRFDWQWRWLLMLPLPGVVRLTRLVIIAAVRRRRRGDGQVFVRQGSAGRARRQTASKVAPSVKPNLIVRVEKLNLALAHRLVHFIAVRRQVEAALGLSGQCPSASGQGAVSG